MREKPRALLRAWTVVAGVMCFVFGIVGVFTEGKRELGVILILSGVILVFWIAGSVFRSGGTFVMTVDRSTRPTYRKGLEVVHPELENTGPAEYDLVTEVKLWLHDGQKNGGAIPGEDIFDYLVKHNMIASCLSLRDAEEIQKISVAAYRQVFGNKKIYFWKSAARCGGHLWVPYLHLFFDDEVVLLWDPACCGINGDNPAARFDE